MKRLMELLKLKWEGSLTYLQAVELRDLLRKELDEAKELAKPKPIQTKGWSASKNSNTTTNYTKTK